MLAKYPTNLHTYFMDTPTTPQPQATEFSMVQSPEPKRSVSPLVVGLASLCVLLLGITVWMYMKMNTLQQEFAQLAARPTPTSAPVTLPPSSTPAATSATTSSNSEKGTTVDETKYADMGWQLHTFDNGPYQLYAPPEWKADTLTKEGTNQIQLIRLWKGADPSSATIQIDIKDNWDNTGDAQYQPKNFYLTPTVKAIEIDPPTIQEKKLDRYQSNFYFESKGKVYVYQCVHNWIPAEFQTCQDILMSFRFP